MPAHPPPRRDACRALGELLGDVLDDVSLYGCFRVTDLGVMHLANPRLDRVNLCGCYKVSDAGRRRLIHQNERILIYNRPRDFGLPHPMHKDGWSRGLV